MLNDYYQNIGMKGFIQRYGIVNAVKRGAFMFIKLHLVKDYECGRYYGRNELLPR